jgi:hypothetical protein
LYHEKDIGATDVYDLGLDTLYNARVPPAVDFYSIINDTVHPNLSEDVRDSSSLTPFHLKMQGNSESYPLYGELSFALSSSTAFAGLNLSADLYKTENGIQTLVRDDIDIRNPNDVTPVILNSNLDFYTVNVRFVTPEPGSLAMLLGIALTALLYWWRKHA